MKRMKKLFAILMTMAMVMGLGITAMAEENDANATIVISNEGAAELSYVQLVEADRDNPDGWSIIAGANIFQKHQIDVGDLGDIAEGTENGDASGTLTTSSELASLLEELKSLATNKVTGDSFDVTSAGLYLVVPVKDGYTYSPTLVYVPVGASGNINVKAKGESDTITKIVAEGGESVQAGDTISYTVTRAYPYISAKYENPTFTIVDTLTNATFNENSVQVTGAGTLDSDYSVNVSENTLTITINYDSAKAGDDITITYSATVSDNVNQADNPVKNKVVSDTNGTKTAYEVVSDPVKTTIYKVDAENTQTKLAGAKFNLYKGLVNEYQEGVTVPVQKDIVVGSNGEVTIYGLDAQENYYLVETEAPQGYSVDKTPIQLTRPSNWQNSTPSIATITDEDGVKVTTATYTFNDFGDSGITQVANTKLSALPETGGMGTTLFTIAGCVIMISAAGLFFATRKKAN